MRRAGLLEKTLMMGKIEGKYRMVQQMPYRWHHWLKGHTFEETPGDSEGQGSLYAIEPQNAKSWTWLRDWTTTTSDLVNGFLKKKKKKDC